MAVDATASVHPSAIVEEGASVGPDCAIGAFSFIGQKVELGRGVTVKSHAVLTGRTTVGEATSIFPFACIGEDPQHLKYNGEPTRLSIGKRNLIREGVTMNTGTALGTGTTTVGDDCLFMTGAHVGHESIVGNGVIMANHSALGGHCIIEDNVIIGGLSGVHQNTRIGTGALIGAVTMVRHDVIPYGLVKGAHGSLAGLNIVGLRRKRVANKDIALLRAALEELFAHDRPIVEAATEMEGISRDDDLVGRVIEFILSGSRCALTAPRTKHGAR